MRGLTTACTLVIGLCLWAGEAAEKPAPPSVFSSVSVELGGRLKADASWDDSRTNTGNYVLWVNQERSGPSAVPASGTVSRNDDEFNMTANETRLWLNVKGPTVNGISSGGKVEVDFYGAGAAENKAHLMLRRAYVDFGWEEYGLSFLAGQHSDVISPLVPTTLNYTVGWDLGNIGYRRPQFRVTEKIGLGEALGGPCSLELTGAITRTVGDSYTLMNSSSAANNTESGEDAGFPTSQARIGVTVPGINQKPVTVGFSTHYGKEEYDGSTVGTWNSFSHRRTFETYSFNADVKVPLYFSPYLDFVASGEYFRGQNLDTYFGGIGQGVNLTRGVAITSEGGWGQLTYNGLLADTGLSFNSGAGVDNPYDGDLSSATPDRSNNTFVFANVIYNLTKQLQLGAEYGWYKTEYRNDREGKANRVQCSVILNF